MSRYSEKHRSAPECAVPGCPNEGKTLRGVKMPCGDTPVPGWYCDSHLVDYETS